MGSTILIWWLVLQVVGLLALPLAAFLFQPLPDRGYAFSKSLGLLLLGYGAWLLAMLGLGSFGPPLLVALLLLLALLSGLLLRWHHGAPLQPAALLGWLREVLRRRWRMVLAYEALFALALLALVWVRSHAVGFVGPHPWGTERPMDFAFFNAIRYSAAFPPADPWLAGFSINYYYFGYLIMAAVATLSGLEPAVAYNLSLAAIFALAALGVAGIVYNLIGLSTSATTPDAADTPPRTPWRHHAARLLVPLLGVVLVLLAGNQAGALQVIVGNPQVVALDGPQLTAAVAQALTSDDDSIELPYPANTAEFGEITSLERTNRLENFDWWWPSRALWDSYPVEHTDEVRRYTITEFPYFSFWLGDMHPHVMALPFNVLALALALATLARPALPHFAVGRAGWLELLLTGLILGSLYTINSWDLPTYVLLYGGALLLLYVRLAAPLTLAVWRQVGQQMLLVVLALILLFLPFHLTFHSLVGFRAPLLDVPLLGRLTQMVAPFVADKSGLHAFLIIFGLAALPLLAFVLLSHHARPARPSAAATPDPEADPPEPSAAAGGGRLVLGQSGGQAALQLEEQAAPLRRPAWALLLSPWLPLALLVLGLLVGFPLLALAGIAVVAFARALQVAGTAERFALLVVALGCAVLFGTELIYVRDVFEGSSARMNTVFKFYYQVWLLWGTIAAFAVWWLLRLAHTPAAGHARRKIAIYGMLGLFGLLLAGGLLYPAMTLREVVQTGTWHGLAGLTPREHDLSEHAAVRWIRQNTAPDSVVLEMVGPGGGSYNTEGYAAVSASTGRPTVLGWRGHQDQWRGGDDAARAELQPRLEQVETIYQTSDLNLARELLRRYGVDYVYVGTLERRAYDPANLTKFAQLGTVVFEQGDVTIYRISTN
jgi:YYY domain-containing protein